MYLFILSFFALLPLINLCCLIFVRCFSHWLGGPASKVIGVRRAGQAPSWYGSLFSWTQRQLQVWFLLLRASHNRVQYHCFFHLKLYIFLTLWDMQISTSLVAYCAYKDWCGVCEGNGQSCCSQDLLDKYCNDNNMCTIKSCGVMVWWSFKFALYIYIYICIYIY